MISVYSVLFTLLLFSELSSHSITVAMPATKLEDGVTEDDGLSLILGDELKSEPALVPPLVYGQSLVLDNNIRDEDGSPKILIISDTRLRGHSVRGLNPALTQSLPLHTGRSLGHTPSEYSLKVEKRDTDLDIMRCMIGRVYRPCWEV